MAKPGVCFVHGDAVDLFRGSNGPRFGGSETQVYQMAKVLSTTEEFDVRLVSDKPVDGAHHPGITFRAPLPPIKRGVPYLSRLVNRKRARWPYEGLEEAVLIQTILSMHTIPTWRTARSLGFKFVYRMSCDADIDGSLYAPEVARQLHEAVRDADGVIAQSETQKERLFSELSVESTVVRSIVDIPPDGPSTSGSYVLWAGRGAPIKRPWIMVETARLLPEIEFVMLMPVEDRLFWRCVAQEAGSIPNLTVVPGVSHFDMPGYYRNAAVFASTSAIEGVPSAFLQSAAQGTPIISLEVDPDGMLESGGLGYCAGGDVDGFRVAIADHIANPGVAQEHGRAAFRYVEQHHSPEAVGPVLREFLETVLTRQSAYSG